VSASHLRAALLDGTRITWTAAVEFNEGASLDSSFAHLLKLAGRKSLPAARIVLERDIIQCRTISPAPPLDRSAARRYVSLEAVRLFRRSGDTLITDALTVQVDGQTRVLWAVAVSERLVRNIVQGANDAGLLVRAVGAAAEVLPAALSASSPLTLISIARRNNCEIHSLGIAGVWRSRLVSSPEPVTTTWHKSLMSLGSDAAFFASAFAAAQVVGRLDLRPTDIIAAERRSHRRRAARIAVVGTALWLLAAAIPSARLVVGGKVAGETLVKNSAELDAALGERRELSRVRALVADLAAADASRSRVLGLLAELTSAIDDSTYLTSLVLASDGMLDLVVQGSSAAAALASVRSIPHLTNAKEQPSAGGGRRITVSLIR